MNQKNAPGRKTTSVCKFSHHSTLASTLVRSNDGLHDKTASTLVGRILVRIIVDCMILRTSLMLSFEYTVYSTDIDKGDIGCEKQQCQESSREDPT